MSDKLRAVEKRSQQVRNEADAFLKRTGLLDILSEYGKPEIVGSYSYDVMMKPDIDIYVTAPHPEVDTVFSAGKRLATELDPHQMVFRNEKIVQTPRLPDGYYWKLEFKKWVVDIWFINKEERDRLCSEVIDFVDNNITSENKRLILSVKEYLYEHEHQVDSWALYNAIFDGTIGGLEDLKTWLTREK